MNIEIPNKFFTTFNDVEYHDEPHEYLVDGKKLISVTTIIHRYQEEFAEDYWSRTKAEEYSLSQKEVLRGWEFINKKGTVKGSAIHDYAESKFLNKVFPYPKQLILDEFGFDPIEKEYDITKDHVDNFYNDVRGKLIPIRPEFVVYDRETLIGGMVDMLFYNVKAKCFQIWDWKTNKKFTEIQVDENGNRTKNKNTVAGRSDRLKGSLFTIYDNDMEIYSLQLAMYKYIIEKNTGIKLGDSYIVWFSHNNENYEFMKTKPRESQVKIMMQERLNELAA
jgi:hypothetical protein